MGSYRGRGRWDPSTTEVCPVRTYVHLGPVPVPPGDLTRVYHRKQTGRHRRSRGSVHPVFHVLTSPLWSLRNPEEVNGVLYL